MLMYLSILDTQDEKEKFTEVYEQYQHFCWYVANQMLGDEHLAEDAVQETFLALTRHLDKIEAVESSRTRKFLMTIVKSKAIDILRKRKPEQSMEESEYELPDPKQDASADGREIMGQLNAFLETLPKDSRLIFLRRYLYGDSIDEIAQRYAIGESKVKMQLHRTREKLRRFLEQEGIAL